MLIQSVDSNDEFIYVGIAGTQHTKTSKKSLIRKSRMESHIRQVIEVEINFVVYSAAMENCTIVDYQRLGL